MKDLAVSVTTVLAAALVMALLFRWQYPLVEMSSELAGLFVFAAFLLRLVCGKVWALWKKPPAGAADAGAGK